LFKAAAFAALCVLTAMAIPSALSAQTPPPRDTARADTTRRVVMPRPPADSSDSTKRSGVLSGLPGTDELQTKVNLRAEMRTEKFKNLRCNAADQAQLSTLSGCSSSFLSPIVNALWSFNVTGTIADRVNLNIDYDGGREFDASNILTAQWVGKPNEVLKRIDVGNIEFAPPSSRFITSSLPSGNFGIQAITKFGRLNVKSIYAYQTGNVVQNRKYTIDARAQQHTDRDVEDYQIERLRFFFTLDPALFGANYPNVDILDRAQLNRIAASLPDTLRPTRVILYRLQFGAQPQNANGPKLRIQGDPGQGTQTYDVLREGVDYIMDPSNLWFALVRPLSETNERLLVAYNVRINGRDTVWVATGGTPDVKATGRDQVANLVMDPSVGPTTNPAAFRREIRSAYRVAGEELVRRKTHVRIVTGGGLVEHPLAGNDATFLQMFGLAQSTNPSEFDYENRLWPRVADPTFNLGVGAVDVRNGQSLDASRLLRDYFLIFPSARPFSRRAAGGLVTTGNPFNEEIYTTPGEYLYSPQHPASLYRIHLQYETVGPDESGYITLNASQMRQRSERVLLDGRPLIRELDYRIDYDLGRIEFLRADTLFRLQRRVEVSYEENPIFQPTPTALAGIVSELPFTNGSLSFSALNQSRSTSATRPQLGFQGASSLTTGISGLFNWKAPALTALVNRLPFAKTTAESHISLQAEVATSHPQFFARNSGDTWIEQFEGTSGINIPLSDVVWQYSSLPAYGRSLSPGFFEQNRASTLVWQTNGLGVGGKQATFTLRQIDSLTTLSGTGFEPNEPVMWLTLQPLAQAGRYRPDRRRFDWTVSNTLSGRRFRSIRTTLSPSGIDLTRGEFLQFWALVDTNTIRRSANPTLVFDFGDISENSLTFAPDTLRIVRNTDGSVDSIFTGKKRQGPNRLDSERDPYSHAFNFEVNDKGLPGDVADTLIVIDGTTVRREFNVPICRYALTTIEFLGNPRANCTVDNSRLDEEDIDLDNALNFNDAQRENERLLRYVVDLSDKNRYKRVGGSYTDTIIVAGAARVRTRHWVLVNVPFNTPTDSLNDVNRRRIRALRLTVVSGIGLPDNEPTQFPLADVRVTGAPWINRSTATLAGIAGVRPGGGFVITSSIGTTDSSATLVYQPPPGVTDLADFKGQAVGQVKTAINEHSMRIQAGNMPLYNRAEAYLRFPSGPQDHRAFKRIRVWGRGRGNGWGPNGDLQMFVKVGRDENNFYLFRAPMESGSTQAAWTDLSIDLSRFVALRRRVQDDYLAGKQESIACTGVDSSIVVASPIPIGLTSRRFAACDGGYMVYTLDPAVTAPNLAAVQEVSAGVVRVGAGGAASPILPSDTLELWVDDVRLVEPDNKMGVAGQLSIGANFADLGDVRFTFSNKDPNFRQVGETPTFLGERNVDVVGTLHLEKFLPQSWGLALPLTINKLSLTNAPRYLTHTDIPGEGFDGLRKPKTELTTYSLSVRRATPVTGSMFAPLVNNIALTTTYVTGTDRTEYQDGTARNLSVGLDYIVTDDSARTARLPGWADGALGSLPSVLQAGPVSALRATAFRWNPTQFRVSSGIVRGDDHRVSFIAPATGLPDQPRAAEAQSRLWRNGSVLEFRPTDALTARWEVQSVRDLRDYGDTSAMALVASRERRSLLGANAGFERERSLFTSFFFSPAFSSWLRPRAELGTQYSMLRDPNSRALVPLPGVIVIDSIIATRDSMALASSLTLARRMTAAQTASVGARLDLAGAFRTYTADSASRVRRFGGLFAPIDISYTRSLLGSFDAAAVNAPIGLQFGLGGQPSFRAVGGVPATTAGQTGTLAATTALQLPFGTSLANRFSRTTTANWIGRFDGTQAQVDGKQRIFPDVALRWLFRPAAATGALSNVDASAGYVKTSARVTLPSISFDAPPDLRHSVIESFPVTGSVLFSGSGGLSTAAKYTYRRQIDSLPGSIARTRGNDVSFDAGRTFRIPASWQLGIRNDLRTRFSFQNTHNSTSIFDSTDVQRARLQDNGRRAFTFTADGSVSETVVLTINGSHIITFDNNLNRRFAYDVVSIVAQIQFFGSGK
jgi:hypothetical protein